MLREVSPNRLWIVETPLRFYGIEVGSRMSVCRLSNEVGSLWVHSPIKLDEGLKGELDQLGPVRFVVCPNKLHHLFVGDYFVAYPNAQVYAAPGLREKRPELPFRGVLGDAPEPGWAQDFDQTVFQGDRQLQEVVFFHRISRTLILADLVQSARPDSPLLTRLVTRLNGTYGAPGPPLPIKLGFRDKVAARAALERVLSWDFERIIIAHGQVVETSGKAVLRRAYSFLL